MTAFRGTFCRRAAELKQIHESKPQRLGLIKKENAKLKESWLVSMMLQSYSSGYTVFFVNGATVRRASIKQKLFSIQLLAADPQVFLWRTSCYVHAISSIGTISF